MPNGGGIGARVKKYLWSLVFVVIFATGLPKPTLAESGIRVCAPGSVLRDPPVTSIPTYDYGADGLLQFHFNTNATGWPFTGGTANIDYNHYNADCVFQGATRYTFTYAAKLPLGRHVVAKVVAVGPGQYNFKAIDGDTGAEIPGGFGFLPPHFGPDAVMGIKFYVAGNYGIPLGFNESSFTTPAVPVRVSVLKTPVLIIPGVLGTELFKGTEKLWIDIPRMINPLDNDAFLDPLAFTNQLEPLDKALLLGEVLRKPNLFFDYTDGLIREFESQGYQENINLFTLPYDWRYGVADQNVQALRDKIHQILQTVGSSQIDVVAHSTGGLLLKKYVQDNPDHSIRKAVLVGVPHLGAPKAIKVLLQGDGFGVIGLSDAEMQKISKHMPVVYHLAPSAKYYTTKGSYLRTITRSLLGTDFKELDFKQTNTFLSDNHQLNAEAIAQAHDLHTTAFDNFDLRTKGIDAYNIVGCRGGTVGQLTELRRDTKNGVVVDGYTIRYVPGDGTVPLESAINFPVDPGHAYYALSANHGKMLSQNGIRQQIVSLITGNAIDSVVTELTQDIGKCRLNGKAISIFSPVSIDIIDAMGNHSGFASDGSIENNIPGVDISIVGEHKFVYLPTEDSQIYTIALQGTGNGTFSLTEQDILDNKLATTHAFYNLPVTTAFKASIDMNEIQPLLEIDRNGDGMLDEIVSPDAELSADESQDVVSPVTTSVLEGTAGEVGFYRSPVNLSLSATDPVVSDNQQVASGLWKVEYSLDHGHSFLAYTQPLWFSEEGTYDVLYAAIDRAGNREFEKTARFTIDMTPPEVRMNFDSQKLDVRFEGIDRNLAYIQDHGSIVITADQAGNDTILELAERDRKHAMSATLTGIRYNNQQVVFSRNSFISRWKINKEQQLYNLTQEMRNKKNFALKVVYDGAASELIGIVDGSKINTSYAGLVTLGVRTEQGQLVGEY
jgi:pimeloyl-ACP methyl ester carboxylesterase